jgi:hypothetical protein
MTKPAQNLIVKNNSRKPPKAGAGRPKGSPNKTTAAIKDMILQALDNKGGVKYLERQAEQQPVAFMGLLAKIMPTQITGQDGEAIKLDMKGLSAAQLKALEAIGATKP